MHRVESVARMPPLEARERDETSLVVLPDLFTLEPQLVPVLGDTTKALLFQREGRGGRCGNGARGSRNGSRATKRKALELAGDGEPV